MQSNCRLDYETKSVWDLGEVGLDNYIADSSTEIILASYAFGDQEPKTWQPHLSDLPSDLEDALLDDRVLIHAWNAAFERNATRWLLGIDLSIQRFRCSMIRARYISLPGYLDECGIVLGIPPELRKLPMDMDFFCLPAKEGGKETLFGLSEPIFRTPESNPVEWEQFVAYSKRDVVAERAIEKRLEPFPLPDDEWNLWFLDQEINERGVMTDSALVEGGSFVASVVKKELLEKIATITKLENPNSNSQILEWSRANGYPFHSLGKSFVSRALAGEGSLTPEAKEVLTIRRQSAKTSAQKLINIAQQVSTDSRLRYQYNFYGARTGRWTSGSGE